eukprot:COSAG05_NODE_372_length_10695_cov_5.301623_5_plen_99_part_00
MRFNPVRRSLTSRSHDGDVKYLLHSVHRTPVHRYTGTNQYTGTVQYSCTGTFQGSYSMPVSIAGTTGNSTTVLALLPVARPSAGSILLRVLDYSNYVI